MFLSLWKNTHGGVYSLELALVSTILVGGAVPFLQDWQSAIGSSLSSLADTVTTVSDSTLLPSPEKLRPTAFLEENDRCLLLPDYRLQNVSVVGN